MLEKRFSFVFLFTNNITAYTRHKPYDCKNCNKSKFYYHEQN